MRRQIRLLSLIIVVILLLHQSMDVEGKRKRKKAGKCPRKVITITNRTGTIQTPRYPKKYKNKQTCIWYIRVKPGYRVKLMIKSRFGIGVEKNTTKCLQKDHLVISSRRQGFSDYSSFSDVAFPHSIVLCGTDAHIGIISSRTNELWVKFRADHLKDRNQIGFKAKYSSVDVDECSQHHRGTNCQHTCINTPGSYECSCRLGYHLSADQRSCIDVNECAKGKLYHGCSHYCENLEGSYRCICPYGMELDASHKKCTGNVTYHILFDGGTINSNNQKVYHVSVPYDAPLQSSVVKLTAKAVDAVGRPAEKPVKYSIIKQQSASNEPINFFQIEEETGVILTKKYLFENDAKKYELIVEGKLDHFIAAKVKVKVDVNGTEPDFSGRFFTVLIYYGLSIDHVIFNLKNRYKNGHDTVFRFQMYQSNNYFGISEDSGKIFIKSQLPKPTSKDRIWRQNLGVLVHRAIGLKIVAWKATVTIIMLPTFPGEGFLTKEMLDAVSREISKDTGVFADRARFSSKTISPFGLHRLFRVPSDQSRKISKAKLFFDTVMQKVQDKVRRTFGSPARSGEPIILRVKAGQILPPRKISEIVDASKCVEVVPMPNCGENSDFDANYRTFDGTCNNLASPSWGAAAVTFKRLIPARYYDIDGLSDPIGFPDVPEAPNIPTPHQIVNELFLVESKSKGRSGVFSHMLMQWGQFIDHDITFTAESEGGQRCTLPRCDWSADDFQQPCFPIMYPRHTGECTLFIRSAAACQTTKDKIEPRQQLNTVTSYLDGSAIYGSSKEQADKLRALNDTGLMKMNDDGFLPFEPSVSHPPNNFCLDFGGCFAAGDSRVNEQMLLASLHTLWVREHNRIAKLLRRYNRHWNGEKIFQEARKIVTAEIQHITYKEYLPKIIGNRALPKYTGYKPNVDATIANSFATAAFRFGHSLVRPTLSQLNANYDRVAPELPLFKAFFNNKYLLKHGIERFLFGAIGNYSETTDRRIAKGLVQQLFQRPGASHGLNLIAINIQRGRDHGLQGYSYWREFCNLTYTYSFDDATNEIRNEEIRDLLKKLYNDRTDHADLFAAGLAEDLVHGAMVGPTFHCLFLDQFTRLRDGDRFFYENRGVFKSLELREIKKTSLAKIMCDNLKGMVSVQRDVFEAFDIPDFRVSCERIKGPNIAVWRENSYISDRTDSGQWSAWVGTVRLATGTWASQIDRNICGNDTITDIQCQTLDGMPYTNAGENTICDQRFGVYCRDSEQAKVETKCSHYRFRVRCAKFPVRELPKPKRPTGFPTERIAIDFNCTKQPKLFYKTETLGVIVLNPKEPLVMIFSELESAVLDHPFVVTPKQEYLELGKGIRGYRKRALFMFDLRRIQRYYIVHSAKLQLYYVGRKPERSNINILARSSQSLITVEVYRVVSSQWSSGNVTSRMPWHGDHLDLSKDVHSRKLSSVSISASVSRWVELDVTLAVKQWRIEVAKRVPNYGLLVRIAGDDRSIGVFQFVSSQHQNKFIHPRLQVCLTNPMLVLRK